MDNYYWLNDESRQFLSRGYLLPGVTPEQRIKQIGDYAEEILKEPGFSATFQEYMSKGWFSLSTPVWANFGLNRGLGISCFGVTIQDNLPDILRASSEVGMLCKYGGGTAGYFGNLRHRGSPITDNGVSSGAVHFMEIFETVANTISQGSSRRGHFAAYLPIDHKDAMEFLNIKDEGNAIKDISIAVTISDNFIKRIKNRDPAAEEIWVRVIQKRFETGYPYIFFDGNVNRDKPKVYQDKGMDIKHSQMCSEILEYTDEEKSFTCCLSSMNLLHFDEWRHTNAVSILTKLLDAVLTDFISRASNIPFLEKTVRFAREHRSIGLGVLGYHSYLQLKKIPFEGIQAQTINRIIFKEINKQSLETSKELASRFGEPLMLTGYGERFTTRIAVAPTTSSSFILGQVSPSIEPLNSNYFLKDLAKGKFSYRNPFLKDVLVTYGKDDESTWHSILMHGGSVQHLKFLSSEEKMLFKTFGEISQLEIVRQAAARQKYIDQGQSLNLMIHPDTPVHEVHSLMLEAYDIGIKTLYYQRSANVAQEVSRDLMNCVSCES